MAINWDVAKSNAKEIDKKSNIGSGINWDVAKASSQSLDKYTAAPLHPPAPPVKQYLSVDPALAQAQTTEARINQTMQSDAYKAAAYMPFVSADPIQYVERQQRKLTDLMSQRTNLASDGTMTEEQMRKFDKLTDEIKRTQGNIDQYVPKTSGVDPAFKGLAGVNANLATFALKNPLSPIARYTNMFDELTGVNTADTLLDPVKQRQQYFADKVDTAKQYKGKGYDTYAFLTEHIAAALPQAILAIMSGGASAASTLSSLGGSAGVSTAVLSRLATMAQNPLFGLSFAQSAGSTYNDAISNGATEDQAALVSTLSGLIVAGVEMTGGLETLPSALQQEIAGAMPTAVKQGGIKAIIAWIEKAGSTVVGKWAMSMLDEGKEEAVQGVIDRLFAKQVYDPDRQLYSSTDPDAVFNPATAAQEFGGGTAIGGILGGGQVLGAGLMQNAATNKLATQDIGLNTDSNTTGSVTTPQDAPQALQAPTATFTPEQPQTGAQGNAGAQNQVITPTDSEHHIDNRTYSNVGSRKVNAFQFDNPVVHPHYAEAARLMLIDLDDSIKGQRFGVTDSDGYFTGQSIGIKRSTTPEIARLLDNADLSYAKIRKALQDIIENHGQENYAAAKRVELVLDDILTNGYTDIEGMHIEPNQEYIDLKSGIPQGEYAMSEGDWDSLMATIPPDTDAMPQGSVGGQGAMPDGLGAADVMFDPFSNMQNQKSQFHPVGENATRDVEIPTTDLDDTNISRSVRTVMEAQATPDAAIPAIENATVRGDFSYMSITDDMSKTRAQDVVKYKGWDAALRDWTADVRRGVVSKDTVALGATLYNNAVNSGNTKLAVDILTDYVANIRSGAQATQAARLLKQMSPEYQLYAVQRSVANLQMELMQKYNDKAPNLVVDPALATAYLDALTSKAAKDIKAAKLALYKSIADQLPSTFADKWNAWRYLSMLGNFRTHIRNILGNAGFAVVRLPKNIVATSLEYTTDGAIKLVNKLFGADYKINRTKAFLNYFTGDASLVKLGISDYSNVQEQILSGGKFNDVRSEIEAYKRPFKNSSDWGKRTYSGKAARGARAATDVLWQGVSAVQQGNHAALDVEDAWFAAPAYAKALASYLKANRVKAEDFANGTMSAEQIDKARATAILEAQKATYRDFNDFSNFVSRLGRGYAGNNKFSKAANIFVEGVLPFKRTPANILARGVEYSPVGLLKGLTYDLYQVSKGNKTAAEAIDQMAAGLTGTALLGLGVLLAKTGLIRGASSDDDKENALDKLQGYQDYALQIGDKSITLDWLAPEAIPFFVGVEIFAAAEHEGETDLKTILNAAAKISDPILETSMLQSLQDLVNSASYSDNGIYNILATAAINYISQGLPTMAGQIERITEQNRESTYIDKTSGTPSQVQATLGKLFNKIPGYDYQQREYTDAFGRNQPSGSVAERVFNNMFNPAYVSDIVKTPVDEEIKRLYQDGALDTVPQQPDKHFSYNSTKYNMSAQEYDRFAKTRGKLVYEQINALISSAGYKDFTDEEKATEIKQLIDFATDQAKKQLVESRRETYKPETRFNDLTAAFDAGIAIDDYYKAYNLYKSLDKDGGLKASEKANVFAYQIDSQFGNLTGAQKELLKENMNYYTIIPAEATRYEKFTEAGLTNSTANTLTTALSALKPLVGKDAVSDAQKYNAVANAKVPDADKLKALSALMHQSTYQKMQTALSSGLSINQYVDFHANISGEKQDKVWAYINSLNISRAQKNALHFAAGYAESSLKKAPW